MTITTNMEQTLTLLIRDTNQSIIYERHTACKAVTLTSNRVNSLLISQKLLTELFVTLFI